MSKDRIHIEFLARISISDLVKRLKKTLSRILHDEFPVLKK